MTFADVGGLDEIKAQIEKRIILPFQKPSLFAKFKKKAGGGILLYGPPGCGKTLLARATAGQCKATFFNVAIEDVLDMYIGESERKLHALFEQGARDDAGGDVLRRARGARRQARSTRARRRRRSWSASSSRRWTASRKNNAGVLILAATNVPWAIDPAFRRPGRFDRVLFVPPPDRAARASILQILLGGRPVAGEHRSGALAERTSGFSGADLENLVDTAADHAIAASLDAKSSESADRAPTPASPRSARSSRRRIEWLTTARNYARYSNEGRPVRRGARLPAQELQSVD